MEIKFTIHSLFLISLLEHFEILSVYKFTLVLEKRYSDWVDMLLNIVLQFVLFYRSDCLFVMNHRQSPSLHHISMFLFDILCALEVRGHIFLIIRLQLSHHLWPQLWVLSRRTQAWGWWNSLCFSMARRQQDHHMQYSYWTRISNNSWTTLAQKVLGRDMY